MAITYPVDVANTRWAIYDTLLDALIARYVQWPRSDGGEIQGGDPRYVYLLEVETARPDYDPRLYYLETIEQPDIPANELQTSYNAVARPLEDRKQAAENEESLRLGELVDLAKEAVNTHLIVTALIKRTVDGETLPPKARDMLANYAAQGVKIWKNRDRLDAIFAEIDAGSDPNLDAGWEGAGV